MQYADVDEDGGDESISIFDADVGTDADDATGDDGGTGATTDNECNPMTDDDDR